MRMPDINNKKYLNQYEQPKWQTDGIDFEKILNEEFKKIMGDENCSKSIKKAKLFNFIAENAPVAVEKEDIFQDKIYSGGLMLKQRIIWQDEVVAEFLKEENEFISSCWNDCGALLATGDYGHSSPNSQLLLKEGLGYIEERLVRNSKRSGLSEKQQEFYESCIITIKAMRKIINRLAEAIKPYNRGNYEALKNVSYSAPQNTYEALQLLIVYFYIHEFVYGARIRTLGRIDVLLTPFYENDIKNGIFTKEEIRELYKFFLYKIWLMKVPYDLPFALGGIDKNGRDVTNEVSYAIVEMYNKLNIYSPKIHIRVCKDTPDSFIKLVLSCIRDGKSSFVFINDEVAMKSLVGIGISEDDVSDYVPIGCYEPAVWGKEIGCTGGGGVNLAKATELVLSGGYDKQSGKFLGQSVGKIENFEDFIYEIKKQISHLSDCVMDYITKIEKHYGEIYPESILSSMYDASAENGTDVYEGGAKYNNSSVFYYCIASLVDSIMAVKKIVFEEKLVTLNELYTILKNNWEGREDLRLYALKRCNKYGNNNAETDEITKEIAEFSAGLCNNKPNGRGGVFKASLFSIDYCFTFGEKTMATPDGRLAGSPLSKNLCATVGMDKKGITSLINSVTKIDLSKFPNGSVLDIVLHPTAVSGDEGLNAFLGILKTYFCKGGFALHGNVFDSNILKDAQKNPDQYKNLQVRLCGWNVFFVNMSKVEQDSFIAQAEQA